MKYFRFGILLIIASVLFYSCSEKPEPVSKPAYELLKNKNIPVFNADNAYNQIKTQVDFGPRSPNTPAHAQALNYFQIELSKYADAVKLQHFTQIGYNNEVLNLTNIIAEFNPQSSKRIMICAHWDSRPRAEYSKDDDKKNKPIPGANDGASGCGVILELARILNENPINYGIDLVLFDGEDYGKENDLDNFCLGSKYFASHLNVRQLPQFAILLDMVGDKEAFFPKEENSLKYARGIVNLIWNAAQQTNSSVFSSEEVSGVYDDHMPLNNYGIRTVDIIDSDLIGDDSQTTRRNYWHSDRDNMDNIGKETLKQLGNTLTFLIYSLHFNNV